MRLKKLILLLIHCADGEYQFCNIDGISLFFAKIVEQLTCFSYLV